MVEVIAFALTSVSKFHTIHQSLVQNEDSTPSPPTPLTKFVNLMTNATILFLFSFLVVCKLI